MNLKKYKVEALGIEIEAPEVEVEKIKTLEKAYVDQKSELDSTKAKLKAYMDAEAEEKEKQITQLVNLKVQLLGLNADTEKEKVSKLSLTEITEEIDALSKINKGKQITPGGGNPPSGDKAWPIK